MKSSTAPSSQKDKKRKTTSLPSSTVDYLKAWMMSPEHVAHPYPTEKEKAQIMADTGIELKQLTNWFVNNRKRYWKPRVEARLKQQVQAQNAAAAAAIATRQRNGDANRVCFKVGIIPAQTNEPVHNTRRQTQQVLSSPSAQNKVNTNAIHQIGNSTNDNGANFGSHYIQVGNSFQTMPPNQYFMTPSGASTNDNSVQAVSMGSASSFSDCDSSSGSHEENNQDHVISLGGFLSTENNQSSLKQSPSKKRDRAVLIASGIENSLDGEECHVSTESLKHEETPSLTSVHKIPSLKRVRLVSDYDAYANQAPIIARPRSLASSPSSSPKRRMVRINDSAPNSWQNACSMASHGYDSTLPTLEEAALLFGFATKK